MFKVNNRNTKTRCEICFSVSIVNFEQVNAGWVRRNFAYEMHSEKIGLYMKSKQLPLIEKCIYLNSDSHLPKKTVLFASLKVLYK